MRVDALLLQRCLQNLLTNALRYAKTVSVTLETAPTGVYVHIDDRGRASRQRCWQPSPTRSCVAKAHATTPREATAWA